MEDIKINGVDAFVAFLKAYRAEMRFSMMFGSTDSIKLLFSAFRSNLEEKGYSDSDIDQFYETIIIPILQEKID